MHSSACGKAPWATPGPWRRIRPWLLKSVNWWKHSQLLLAHTHTFTCGERMWPSPTGEHTPAGFARGMRNHHEKIRWGGDLPTITDSVGLLCFSTGRGGALEGRMLVILPRQGSKHRGADAQNQTGSSNMQRGDMAPPHVPWCMKDICWYMTQVETSWSGCLWGACPCPSPQ